VYFIDRQATQIEDLDIMIPKIEEMEAMLAGEISKSCELVQLLGCYHTSIRLISIAY
jgi:hypothetical protein